MGKLIYSVIGSLDGFINDASGSFDWAEPGEDLVDHINEEMVGVSTYLYGRRMYETMAPWETDPSFVADQDAASQRFARIWQRADKVVYSRTLSAAVTERTTIEREFSADAVRARKESVDGDLTIEGPTLAAHALRAGLVDEVHRYVAPAVVGAGTPLYPAGLQLGLELLEGRRFDRDIVYLRYAVV